MLTLIHGADFHLDSPFSGLSPQLAAQRRREQRDLLARLVDTCLTQGAQLLLLSGDLFDGARVFGETIEALSAQLGRLSCPVFIAPGNHDFYSAQSPYATHSWPQNVHIFSTGQVESVELPLLNCVVHGAAFLSPRLDRSPLEGFSAPREDGKIHLMALHGALDGADYGPISKEMIAQSGLHYLALGHVHQPSPLLEAGATHYAYAGCPQGRGFDETGERGVMAVTLDGTAVTSQFIPLCQSRYEISTVDVEDVENLLAHVEPMVAQWGDQDSIRLILTGERQTETLDTAPLYAALAPRFFSLDIRDNTRPPQALWARGEEDSLTGLFLQTLLAQGAEGDTLTLAARFGLAALEGREEVAP